MANKYNPHLIQINESYSINEITKLFDIDKKTCFRWIKLEGLKVIEKNTNPLLIMGSNLKEFIIEKRQKRKIKLNKNQFYCCSCQKAVLAKNGSTKIIKTGKTIGKNEIAQLKKIGICETCEKKLNRYLSTYQKD